MSIFIKSLFLFVLVVSVFAFDYADVKNQEDVYGSSSKDVMKFTAPVREFSIIFTDEGYYPKSFSAFEGEKIRFFVTSTAKKTDKGCFLMPHNNLFLSAHRGHVTEGEAFFSKPGTFHFYCPNTQARGKLVVIKKKESAARRIASEDKRSKIWMPKEI